MVKIGVISDTHGFIREEVLNNLKDVSVIIHAGDFCSEEILMELKNIAPVYGVRGNNDKGSFGESLPKEELIDINGKYIYVVHDIKDMSIVPESAGVDAVIYGHSHKHKLEEKNGVLYINPGSAGKRRFKLPITMAYLYLNEEEVESDIVIICE
ncbi:metallophosphoesterase family protein [Clostridium polynesiense]|uniref:metallophosphoesterase family protein n=1 Tax=Clostridium polynesiense TaxID=1325933 RepID=UPI0006950AC3|nr:metallophosphoesterase family protein [Clostridium polynesiense]